ncbi:MAG: acyl-CoA thioesterase [Sphingobium sp.]
MAKMKTVRITHFLDGDAPFSCLIPTRFADVDWNGHINNVATAQIIEDARTRFSDWMGVLDPSPRPDAVRYLTASLQVDYVGEAYYPEPYAVHAAVSAIGTASWSYILTARQQGRVVAAAYSTQTGTLNGVAQPLPKDMRARLAEFMIGEDGAPVALRA